MAQSLSNILVHIVFSTKERRSWLNDAINNDLYPYITKTLNIYGCNTLKIGGIDNHIHILCVLSKNYALSEVIEKIKNSSSKWIKSKGEKYKNFYWQKGYGVFSISPSHKNVVINYIANQAQHHKQTSFEEELENILKKYNVEYDQKYLWN
jgi:putative transposase